MIKNKTHDISVSGTAIGEEIPLGIDEDSMEHIMSVLTDLYSDPETAIIREYSTNAYDAHIEAKQKRPIEVILPSRLAPTLTIKDFGIGLNADDIRDIYSKYGSSTKRNTNKQVGTLGLGCKSALTYTAQFTLVGVKGGIQTTAMVGRNARGAGAMTIIDEIPTTEPNGVEIQIPAKEVNSLESKAKKFFSYWEKGTVLINGEAPADIQPWMKLTKDIWLLDVDPYNKHKGDRVVMGNVPYPVYFNINGVNKHILAFVKIGEVNFTPDRESLADDKNTKDKIEEIKQIILSKISHVTQVKINKATSKPKAIAALEECFSAFGENIDKAHYTYRGKKLPTVLDWPKPLISKNDYLKSFYDKKESDYWWQTNRNYYRTLSSKETKRNSRASEWNNKLWVLNYDRTTFTAVQKKKIIKYCDDNKLDEIKSYFIFPNRQPPHEVIDWVDSKQVVEWEVISKIKLPTNRATGSAQGEYPSVTINSHGHYRNNPIAVEDIDVTKPLFHHHEDNFTMIKLLLETHVDATAIILAANRKAKFLRLFPEAKDASIVIKELHQEKFDALDKISQESLRMSANGIGYEFSKFNEKKIKDPDLKRVIRAYKMSNINDSDKIDEIKKFWKILWKGGLYGEFNNPLDKYPLYNGVNLSENEKHTYDYLNWVYEGIKNKK